MKRRSSGLFEHAQMRGDSGPSKVTMAGLQQCVKYVKRVNYMEQMKEKGRNFNHA